jgi:hypothetical protein
MKVPDGAAVHSVDSFRVSRRDKKELLHALGVWLHVERAAGSTAFGHNERGSSICTQAERPIRLAINTYEFISREHSGSLSWRAL